NEACPHVDCYGIGMGDTPWYLLTVKKVAALTLHCLNLKLLKLLLTYTDQREWLTHPNLELVSAPARPSLGVHWLACTADLRFCDPHYYYQRDIFWHEKNLSYANSRHESNRALHLQRFEENRHYWQYDPDALLLAAKLPQHRRVLILASGPSLEEHFTWLEQVSALPQTQKPLIIALDTALKGLVNYQITIDIVVSIDELITPETAQVTKLKSRNDFAHNMALATESELTLSEVIQPKATQIKCAPKQHYPALVYFPRSRQELLAAWPGPRYAAYSDHPLYDDLEQQTSHCRLYANGSVIHPAVDLALNIGASNMYLLGADFGFMDEKTHAAWEDGSLGIKHHHAKHQLINGHGEKIATTLNFISYLRALELLISKHPRCTFTRLSQRGAAITGCDYHAPDKLLHDWQTGSKHD
ncbi:MAG: 6-hydroxymethylpterin diphosphokinase MptE-like protein, partial [Shewanella sp.]